MRIASLIPRLPRTAWILLSGDLLSSLGNGLLFPFFIVYLRDVRHIDVGVAGLVLSTFAMVGLVGNPAAGSLVDRTGARRTLMGALAISVVGCVALALVRETWHAFGAAAILGLGTAAFWPAVHSLLASVVSPEQRSSVFSVHYATLNLGFGIGGLVGGAVVNRAEPFTFELLYYVDALTFLPFIAILAKLHYVGAPVREAPSAGPVPGYRSVLSDIRFLRVLVLTTLLVTIGYSQLNSSFPAFATRPGDVSPQGLAVAFAVNTAVIVVSQMFVLRAMAGRRRTRGVVAMAGLWIACWLATMVAGPLGGGIAAVAGFSVAMALFALGETVMSPTMSAVVQDLASDATRGRYTAVYSLTWTVGSMIGPAIAGFALDAGHPGALFIGLIAGCGVAAAIALDLERHIPPEANVVAFESIATAAAGGPSHDVSLASGRETQGSQGRS